MVSPTSPPSGEPTRIILVNDENRPGRLRLQDISQVKNIMTNVNPRASSVNIVQPEQTIELHNAFSDFENTHTHTTDTTHTQDSNSMKDELQTLIKTFSETNQNLQNPTVNVFTTDLSKEICQFDGKHDRLRDDVTHVSIRKFFNNIEMAVY